MAAVEAIHTQSRGLPSNVEAEQALLGAIMNDNRAYDVVAEFLTAEHFFHVVHGEIFEACSKHIEGGRHVDAVTLSHVFSDHDGLREVGGAGYLAGLVQVVPSIINARDYGMAVFDTAVRRQQILLYGEAAARARDMDTDSTGLDVLEETEGRLQEIAEGGEQSSARSTEDGVPAFLNDLKTHRERGGGLRGMPTGFSDLDRMTNGLIAPKVIVLAARPSMGKTSLATNIATRVATAKAPVLIYSLEMSERELLQRMVSERCGISSTRIERAGDLTEGEMLDIERAADEVRRLPIHIDDRSTLTVQAMLTRARRLQRRSGLSLVIVDHLGYVRSPQRRDNRTLELGDITKALRTLAKALGVPVLVLCQLNRASQNRDDKRPQLSDLRQSGEIEEDADQVWFIHRDYYYLKRTEPTRKVGQTEEAFKIAHAEWLDICGEVKNLAEVIVAKNRNGPQDTVKMFFDETTMRFDNLQKGLL